MIHLRPQAVQELRRLLNRSVSQSGQENSDPKRSDLGVRVRLNLEPGACAEWIYQLTAAPSSQADEQVFDCEGIAVVVPNAILPHVQNLTIDYAEDLMGGGFRFVNPQAVYTCGCGNAFSLQPHTSEPSTSCVQPAASFPQDHSFDQSF